MNTHLVLEPAVPAELLLGRQSFSAGFLNYLSAPGAVRATTRQIAVDIMNRQSYKAI